MTHTKTPWAIQESFSDGHHIGPEKYHTICTVKNGAEDEEYGGSKTEKANAEFIVHACNAHKELVEALETALEGQEDSPWFAEVWAIYEKNYEVYSGETP